MGSWEEAAMAPGGVAACGAGQENEQQPWEAPWAHPPQLLAFLRLQHPVVCTLPCSDTPFESDDLNCAATDVGAGSSQRLLVNAGNDHLRKVDCHSCYAAVAAMQNQVESELVESANKRLVEVRSEALRPDLAEVAKLLADCDVLEGRPGALVAQMACRLAAGTL